MVSELRRGGGDVSLAPREVLDALQGIERQLGSKKLVARGPRIIDLDVLLYNYKCWFARMEWKSRILA